MKCAGCGGFTRGRAVSMIARCPHCGRVACFDPRVEPLSDVGFERAVSAVSGEGSLRWTIDQLYYTVGRGVRRRRPVHRLARRKTVSIQRADFDRLLVRWQGLGLPLEGRIDDVLPQRSSSDLDADIAGLAIDRAVICDHSQMAEFLLANRFHVEHRCIILSEDGHPAGAFSTAMELLRRSQDLTVVALHDADPGGCGLERRLRGGPDWFAGQVTAGRARVVDVGLRPRSAARYRGSLRAARPDGTATPELSEWELRWLGRYRMEVAALPPRLLLAALPSAWSEASSATEDDGVWMWPQPESDEDYG